MKLTSDIFQPLIGTDLTVYLDDGTPFPLHLEKLTPATRAMMPEPQDDTAVHTAFTLDLKGPREPVLLSLTYPVMTGEGEPIHLFISPHAQDEDATYYNIVVN